MSEDIEIILESLQFYWGKHEICSINCNKCTNKLSTRTLNTNSKLYKNVKLKGPNHFLNYQIILHKLSSSSHCATCAVGNYLFPSSTISISLFETKHLNRFCQILSKSLKPFLFIKAKTDLIAVRTNISVFKLLSFYETFVQFSN